MQLRVMTEPQQGATYDDLLRVASESERLGFDAFFRSDHFQRIGTGDPGPGSTDAWVTLAGLARDTTRIRLGTMVSSATFRLPGPLAIAVATVDAMSGGRIELGIGSGWYEAEHRSYGIPFPPVSQRFDLLEESLETITGLWRTPVGETFSHPGAHVSVEKSPALPKPVQRPHPPVIIGGTGKRRTPALAARFAAEYNVPFAGLDVIAASVERAWRACVNAERDPDTLILSVAQSIAIGEDETAVRRQADTFGITPADLRREGLAGSADEVLDKLGRLGDLGVRRVYLQILDLDDLDPLALVADQVLSRLESH